jgi:hypothetical protein
MARTRAPQVRRVAIFEELKRSLEEVLAFERGQPIELRITTVDPKGKQFDLAEGEPRFCARTLRRTLSLRPKIG